MKPGFAIFAAVQKSPWIIAFGPLAFTVIALALPLEGPAASMLGILSWMLIWWISEVVPIGVTALLPLILFPLTGIMSLEAVSDNYANPIIFLFFGGFVLGLAIEKWNLHRRIALLILQRSGPAPRRIILGAMAASFGLSMWISNTSTTVMMLPIGLSLITLLSEELPARTARSLAMALLLGIAYAANVGGMATLIGTPPNLVWASLLEKHQGIEWGFARWFIFALPLALLLFGVLYLLLSRVFFRLSSQQFPGIAILLRDELARLGPATKAEKRVALVLLVTASLWIGRNFIQELPGLAGLSDPLIAVAAAVSLFLVPVGGRGPKVQRVLHWEDASRLPWGILLLFGGGLSIAAGLERTDLVQTIGMGIGSLDFAHPLLLIFTVTALALGLTEVMSNVALVSVFIPVTIVLAQSLEQDVVQLTIPLTLAASCAFMFPISTPPNAIVFSSGKIAMSQMIRVGIWLNLISIVLISLYSWFLLG